MPPPGPLLLSLALAATLPLPAAAQSDKPDVSENAWLDFDLSKAKEGEWAKYRLEREGEKPIEYRVACVAVEAEVVWIEEDRTTAEFHPGTVILCSVSLKDRKVKRAFWGKPGEKARELNLTKAMLPDPGNDAATGTVEVAAGAVAIKGKEHATERVEFKTETEGLAGVVRTRQVIVTAEGIPFPLWVDEKGQCRASISEGKLEWKGKAAWKGGLTLLQFEGGTKYTLALTDWGAGAKQTLDKP
jgi:hypothetical protein